MKIISKIIGHPLFWVVLLVVMYLIFDGFHAAVEESECKRDCLKANTSGYKCDWMWPTTSVCDCKCLDNDYDR